MMCATRYAAVNKIALRKRYDNEKGAKNGNSTVATAG